MPDLRSEGTLELEYLGLIAGLLIALSMLPQIMRLIKLRSAYEISLWFTILRVIGLGFWITYGVLGELISIIIWNSVLIIMSLILLLLKIKYGLKSMNH